MLIITLYSTLSFAEPVLEIDSPGVKEVDIYVRSNFDEEAIKVGKTPFKDSLKSFTDKYSKVNIVAIELKKEGYHPESFVLIKGASFDVKLKFKMRSSSELLEIQKYDALISDLFKIQNLIRSQDYNTAITRLDDLEKEHKQISIIPELKGISLYLKKDIERSLASFREAFSKNSKNSDAYKMKVYLEKKLGVSGQ